MVRVCIVDDHASFRDSLAFMVGYQDDLEIVGQAGSLAEARAMVASTAVDVALLDLDLPDGQGLELMPTIHSRNPAAAVIILTGSIRPESQALAIAAGAVGFLHKSTSVSEIVQAIRKVAGGQSLLSTSEAMSLMRRAAQHQARLQETQQILRELTPREREVLQALAGGLDNQAIADRLSLSVATVRTHVVRVLQKLNVSSRLQAALFAVRAGVVSSDDLG